MSFSCQFLGRHVRAHHARDTEHSSVMASAGSRAHSACSTSSCGCEAPRRKVKLDEAVQLGIGRQRRRLPARSPEDAVQKPAVRSAALAEHPQPHAVACRARGSSRARSPPRPTSRSRCARARSPVAAAPPRTRPALLPASGSGAGSSHSGRRTCATAARARRARAPARRPAAARHLPGALRPVACAHVRGRAPHPRPGARAAAR